MTTKNTTDESQDLLATQRSERKANREAHAALRESPLERIADAVEGYDDEYDDWHGPVGRQLASLTDTLDRVAFALEEIARCQSPGWRTQEQQQDDHRRRLEERANARRTP